MIKKNLKLLIITSFMILLPVIAGALLWDKLPSEIPSHWNMKGEVDGYSTKAFAVFGMPMIFLSIHWLTALVTSADPKNKNHSGKVISLIFWIIPAVSVLIAALTYSAALEKNAPVEVIVNVLVGLVLVIVGNYLPKCRQSYTVGIKLPWTLNNEENWAKTHRLAGKVWVACGLAVIAAGFLKLFPVMIAAVLLAVAVPTVYSYVLHRRGL